MSSTTAFTGSVPTNYENYLGPLFFEPYALDLVSRIEATGLKNILELACGTGRVTKHLISKMPRDARLYATDLNSDMIEIAKTKLPDERITWQVVDAHQLPYEEQFFDLVICQYGVMFFTEKDKAFKEMFRVLKEGGQLLFNTWDELKYNVVSMTAQDVMEDFFPNDPPQFFQKAPYSMFNETVIRTLLTDSGFQNLKIEKVAFTSTSSSPEDVVTGIIEGTPLVGFINERNAPKDAIKLQLKEKLISKYGKNMLHLPMQAFVCSAIK